jgi:alkaline phosphatase
MIITKQIVTIVVLIIILFLSPVYAIENVKNIIFYIGDGMGIAQILTARISLLGAEGRFSLEKMPVTGLITTHSIDNLITDSAASATAMATGFKTRNGMISVSPDSQLLETFLEAAALKGWVTGLLATSSITHATPASFASHVASRSNHNEIAKQLVNSRTNLLLGGGRSYFLSKSAPGSKRTDDLDLFNIASERGFEYVSTAEQLVQTQSSKVLGLFALEAMGRADGEPTLAEMSQKAIEILSRNSNGFILIIEGSQIDWAGHDNNFESMVREMADFDDAIKIGLEFAQNDTNTLVVVTADHETGGLMLTGGGVRGTDIRAEWMTKSHTGQYVPVFAAGPGSIFFSGINDNTFFATTFARLLDLRNFSGFKQSYQ